MMARRWFDIDSLVRKTLINATVVGCLMSICFAVILLFSYVLHDFTGYRAALAAAVVAGLAAPFFQPLRRRLEHLADRKFFRHDVNREERLHELSRDVIAQTSPEAVAAALSQALQESFHPKSAALWLRGRDGKSFTSMACFGETKTAVMPENNPLHNYFIDHSQPFVQDSPAGSGSSRSTRESGKKGRGSR